MRGKGLSGKHLDRDRDMTLRRLAFLLIALVLLGLGAGWVSAKTYRFSGGPSGGTFQYYASAISTIAKKNNLRILASSSGGALENIRTTNSGKSSFSITYAGELFAASKGKLKNDGRVYDDVRVVSSLYGAPAQLVVRKDSGIERPSQLAGKRVAIGNAGSGAAANAEIFFSQLGIWDKISRENLGYRAAADAFKNGQLDAFWVFVGYPNASVLEAALQQEVVLLDLYTEAEQVGLFETHPYFSRAVIPANTYNGQTEDVATFQDAAIWVANKDVPEDLVYNLLRAVYSDEGLAYLTAVHKSAKGMSIETGLKGVANRIHPGALRFFREMGAIE